MLIQKNRFFAEIIMRLVWVETSAVETMATDGTHLFVCEAACAAIGLEKTMGVLVHEACHITNRHHLRMGDRPLRRFNIAGDLAINPPLLRDGYKLPEDLYLDNEGLYRNLTAEQIDDKLAAEEPKPTKVTDEQAANDDADEDQADANPPPDTNSSDQPTSCSDDTNTPPEPDTSSSTAADPATTPTSTPTGSSTVPETSSSGSSGDPAAASATPSSPIPLPSSDEPATTAHPATPTSPTPGPPAGAPTPEPFAPAARWGEIRPALDDAGALVQPKDLKRAETKLDHIIKQAADAARLAGQLPGWIEEIIEASTSRPDWTERLATHLGGLSVRTMTPSRPNRRYIQAGVWMPGQRHSGAGRVAFGIDTSGSITTDLLEHITAAAIGVVEDTGPDELVLIQCDTAIRHVQYLTAGETPARIVAKGRGGTLFQPVFDWVAENMTADVLIYATDLDCWDEITDPGIPVIWLTPNTRKTMPFGETVVLPS